MPFVLDQKKAGKWICQRCGKLKKVWMWTGSNATCQDCWSEDRLRVLREALKPRRKRHGKG